jgi:phosphoribosylaminoimidazolecarboxamide formyltransferase / IMP cyclohydrolase
VRERCALLSVYDKTGIEDFARALVAGGWRIYASGGTAKTLAAAGIATTDVADLVGGSAILGHRVVTLSREVHAGLLARPVPEDLEELDRLGVPFIDLVCVDLYPLAEEIGSPGATTESVIEKTDIGGPTMLRSAAKGRRIVVSLPEQRARVLAWLADGEPDAAEFRNALAAQAEAVVADYCLASARYHSQGRFDGVVAQATRVLKYGENAGQAPAHLLTTATFGAAAAPAPAIAAPTTDPLALDRLTLLAGTEPSYNNLAEVGRQIQTITHIAAGFERNFDAVPCIALGTKHGNACGAAVGESPVEVVRTMVMGDPRAIFGGLVMLNFAVTQEVAAELLTYGVPEGRRVLDAVTAPPFEPAAVEMLSRKGDKCRFLANEALGSLGAGSLDATPMLRQVRGGLLRQPNYTWVPDLGSPEVTRIGELSDAQKRDLILAWAICATSNSNTVTLTRDGGLLGNGVGQQDRVGCCELALKRAADAGHKPAGAVAASDSFFPQSDGPQTLIDAGISAIWATSGSVRDEDTHEVCRQRGVALWQVPDSVGRGFFGH